MKVSIITWLICWLGIFSLNASDWQLPEWNFRTEYTIPDNQLPSAGFIVQARVDFSLLLKKLAEKNNFDIHSIRILNAASDEEIPFSYDLDKKDLFWRSAIGAGIARKYYVYFDSMASQKEKREQPAVVFPNMIYYGEWLNGGPANWRRSMDAPDIGSSEITGMLNQALEVIMPDNGRPENCSFKITGAPGIVPRWHFAPRISVIPGRTLELTASLKMDKIDPDTMPEALAWLCMYNKMGNVEGIREYQRHPTVRKTKDHQKIELHWKVPENAAFALLRLEVWKQSLTAVFSDLNLKYANPPFMVSVENINGRKVALSEDEVKQIELSSLEINLD